MPASTQGKLDDSDRTRVIIYATTHGDRARPEEWLRGVGNAERECVLLVTS